MRSLVLRLRIASLSRVAAVALIGGAAAGCSSDFSRFDAGLQSASVGQNGVAQNPYPGVDQAATGSIANNGAPVPMVDVSKDPVVAPDHAGYDPSLAQNNSGASGGIQRAELPKLEQQSARAFQDPVRNGSVGQEASAQDRRQTGEKGWTRTGGTTITLREGETLYNLTRRYGVPVSDLVRANDLKDADHVRAGQQIVVPVYEYGANLGVSAPDNDPNTRKASAGRGFAANDAGAPPEKSPVKTVRTVKIEKVQKTDTAAEKADAARRVADRSDSGAEGVDPMITGGARNQKTEVESTIEAKSNEAAPERSGFDVFRWPVHGRIISNFGDTIASGKNDGIDISVPEGTAVKAVENGVVVYAGNELQGLGNLVLVQHADGWVSAYAHNRDIEVKRGDEVRRGEILARSGRTGNADSPKLHFELRRHSKPVDPVRYLDGA